jgi:hypothetical protein
MAFLSGITLPSHRAATINCADDALQALFEKIFFKTFSRKKNQKLMDTALTCFAAGKWELLSKVFRKMYGVRFFRQRIALSRMPLVPTLLLHLKLLHACVQRHSSRVSAPLTSSHCKLRPPNRFKHCRQAAAEARIEAAANAEAIAQQEAHEQDEPSADHPEQSSGQSSVKTPVSSPVKSTTSMSPVRFFLFRQEFTLKDAIGSPAFAPLEALPCGWPVWHSSRVPTASYRFTL